MPSKLPDAKVFSQLVAEYAKLYPYVIYSEIREGHIPRKPSDFPLVQFYLRQPFKMYWHAVELLAFEGSEFAEAMTQLLRGRASSASERLQFQDDSLPWTRIAFILQLDQDNRNESSPVRVMNLNLCRCIWRAERFFARRGLESLAHISWRLFRKRSLWIVYASLGEISLRQLMHILILATVDSFSGKLDSY
jgi:hypothetical protein